MLSCLEKTLSKHLMQISYTIFTKSKTGRTLLKEGSKEEEEEKALAKKCKEKYECRFRNRRKHAKICNKYLRNKREREREGEEKKRRKKSQNKIFVMRL